MRKLLLSILLLTFSLTVYAQNPRDTKINLGVSAIAESLVKEYDSPCSKVPICKEFVKPLSRVLALDLIINPITEDTCVDQQKIAERAREVEAAREEINKLSDEMLEIVSRVSGEDLRKVLKVEISKLREL
jgi:hypothetical protein